MEAVKNALENNGVSLVCASDHLNNGEQNALIAGKQNGWALQYASIYLRCYKNFVPEAIKLNHFAYQSASCDLQKDEEVMKAYQ